MYLYFVTSLFLKGHSSLDKMSVNTKLSSLLGSKALPTYNRLKIR